MNIIDDPLLALLVRFVGVDSDGDPEDGEFVRRQIATIKTHIEQFPEQERTERALQWIARHAKRYRQHWQRLVAAEQLADVRCPDCPLVSNGNSTPCAIHQHWLELLRAYTSHKISSPEYVERSLALLAKHKARLRIKYRGAEL